MIQQFVYKYLNKEYQTIQIDISGDKTAFNTLRLKKKETSILILEQKSFNSFERLTENIRKEIPLILAFNGKKIISKILTKEPNYIDKLLFNQDPDDYYIFEYEKPAKTLVSLIRRDILNPYMDSFLQKGYTILDFSIGPFILENLAPLLLDPKIIRTPEFEYDLDNTLLSTDNLAKKSEAQLIQIGEEKIFNVQILGFAAYLGFLNQDRIKKNYQFTVDAYSESFSYKKSFYVLGKAILIFFLILLSASYVIKTVYTEKSSKIQHEAMSNAQVLNQIALLEKDKEYKTNIIANSSLGSKYALSFYIGKIAETLPETILLERLEVFPAKKPISPNEKIRIEPNIIEVEGITPSNSSVTQWVELLNSYGWIKKVEVLSYAFVKNGYVFKLNLYL